MSDVAYLLILGVVFALLWLLVKALDR